MCSGLIGFYVLGCFLLFVCMYGGFLFVCLHMFVCVCLYECPLVSVCMYVCLEEHTHIHPYISSPP